MFSIATAESARVLRELKKAREQINREILEIYRGFVTIAYISVVENTPQWTGHATAQWNIGINSVDNISASGLYAALNMRISEEIRSKRASGFASPAKKKGDPEAVNEAKKRQATKVKQIDLDDIVFISNNVENLLNEVYASKLEENPNNYLRPENDGGHMVAKTIGWFNSRLALIDPVSNIRLRKVTLAASDIMETF